MTTIFNEMKQGIDTAIKRGDSPNDLITAQVSCLVGTLIGLKLSEDIKKLIFLQAAKASGVTLE